ncbi:MAG: putative transcriptional regulator [Rhodobacteraceae bacterium HLUCCA12]|nr:MAG: putative transcriptional regulator [Rhodobacteraceae bacterium HLUCCA12]
MAFDLTGRLLIATPAMGDPRFARSVILLCAHGDDGAFGLVINRPMPDLTFAEVLEQLAIGAGDPPAHQTVLAGGPVEPVRGFVLYRDDDAAGTPEDAALPGGLALSASPEILEAIARGTGPADWVLALGYAGWGPGQLEEEIAQNGWLTADCDPALVFSPTRGDALWQRALQSMGVDPLTLSAVAGHA